MIVVSNTSPIHYLVLIEADHVLPALYREVVVPTKVLEELRHGHAPQIVRAWADGPPPWLLARAPTKVEDLNLHPGETHAIALAEELSADRILIDERRAFRVAKARGLNPVGVLGVLYEAAGSRLIDLSVSVTRLTSKTNFRVTPSLIEELLRRHGERSP